MTTTKITFLGDGKIEGFADICELSYGFQTEPDALWWKTMPLLTADFTDKIAGTITLLEYRDGNLWCEATLNDYGAPWARWPEMFFGVKALVNDYEFVGEGEDDILVVKRAEVLEIGLTHVDKG